MGGNLMVSAKAILTAVDAIAASYKPLKILLFGSYAYGVPNADSDVDFLVLKNFRGSPHEQFVKIRTAIDFPFPLDLLVRRPDVVRQRIEWNDFFLKEIMEQGIVLYASDDAGAPRNGGCHLFSFHLFSFPGKSNGRPLPIRMAR